MSHVPGASPNPLPAPAPAEAGAVSSPGAVLGLDDVVQPRALDRSGPVAASAGSTAALALVFWIGLDLEGASGAGLVVAALLSIAAAGACRVVQRATEPARASSGGRVARAVAVATVGELVLLAGASATGASLGTAVVAATWGAATWIAATSSATRQAELHYRARSRRVFLIATEQEVAAFADEAARQGGVSLVETELCLIDGTLADSTAGVAERVAAVRPSVVVVADRCVRHDDVAALAWQILVTGVHVRRLSDFYEMEFHKVALASVGRSWFLFDVAEIHRRRLYGSAKRLAESSIALALLVAAVPAVVAAALAIRLSSPGPILFTQARVGRGGGQFRLIKFRTMHCRAPGEDCDDEWARTDDPRIFRAGRVLRRFRIDELPQLWNVLRGDLSLIGPRPEQPQIAAGLAQTVPFYETRTCVRPGLTGWAQVNYGYGGSTLGSWAKLEYDLYYIKHQSLALDLKVLLATVTTVAAGGG